MALGRGKLIGVIGDEDTCVGKKTMNNVKIIKQKLQKTKAMS
jgi:hypothetical protein